jgi:pyrroloquinoline quinone biosynthesis protein D
VTTEPAGIDPAARPRLARGVRLRHDEARGEWVLLAPERVVQANAIAVAVLQLCDGQRSFADLVDALAEQYKADRALIEKDVGRLLSDLGNKRMVEL